MELAPIFNLNLKLFEFEKMYQNQNCWNLKNWSQTRTWRTSKNIWSDKTRTKGSLKKEELGDTDLDTSLHVLHWDIILFTLLLTSQMCILCGNWWNCKVYLPCRCVMNLRSFTYGLFNMIMCYNWHKVNLINLLCKMSNPRIFPPYFCTRLIQIMNIYKYQSATSFTCICLPIARSDHQRVLEHAQETV
jgi:hypothetical protein